jgi:tetratricopeptide (TPR) repeat protein
VDSLPDITPVQTFVQNRGGEYFDAELAAEVERLGKSLAKQSRRPDLPYNFTILDRSAAELHIFAKGQIFMTRGLVSASSDVQQLADLLALAVAEVAAAPEATQHQVNVGSIPARPPGVDTPDASGRLAEILSNLHQYRQGYDLYETARRREKAGDLSGAISDYLKAATAAPDQPQILTGLGLAYLLAGDLQSARVHLQRSVRLQPDYYLNQMGLGYVDLQRGRYDEAIIELEKSVKLLPGVRNRFLLAESYEKSGQPQAAIPLYRAVVLADGQGKLGRTSAERLRQLGN